MPVYAVLAYAGIGSRATPVEEQMLMARCAVALYEMGWTLRTGGADGADDAFLRGYAISNPLSTRPSGLELYLPWLGFNGHAQAFRTSPSSDAYKMAAKYHPAWPHLSWGTRALLARDVHQVLGPDVTQPRPIKVAICWTADGSVTGQERTSGGTGMALRVIAGERPEVTVYNLARHEHRQHIEAFVNGEHIAIHTEIV